MKGIQYLHCRGIVRKPRSSISALTSLDRDIKPANILLTTDSVVKISDFGIAEEFGSYTNESMRTSAFTGTHKFLSPEVVDGSLGFDGEKGIFLPALPYLPTF